jgi:Nif-specific regulatory protein
MWVDSSIQRRALTLLHEASALLDEAQDVRASVKPILEALTRHLNLRCATLTVLNRRTSEILVHEAVGLTEVERQRARYRLGEGITGQVVETGEPVVVPSIAAEPRFLDRVRAGTGRASETAFLCVPVRLGK